MNFIETSSVYLSGQIAGLHPEVAQSNFDRAAKNFDWEYTTVVHPIEYAKDLQRKHLETHKSEMKVHEILLAELKMITSVETIFMLRGWEKSPGATIEKLFAEYCGKEIIYEL